MIEPELITKNKNNNIKICMIYCILILFAIFFAIDLDAQNPNVLSKEFYANLQSSEPIRRDFLLDGQLNKIIQGKGYVDSIDKTERYHRRFRIVVIGNETPNLNIIYYLFTDNEEYIKVLNKKDLFEFKGQFVIYTPLSSRRDSYIFDIIMEDGAILIE